MAIRRSKHTSSCLLRVLVAVLLGLLLGAVQPRAAFAQQKKQSVEALITKGQELFDEQRYEESVQVLSAGLMRPGTDKAEKIKIYQLLAYNYIVLRRNEEADGAVRGLLVLDEDFELPDTESPRFRDFFNQTREAWEEEGKPGLEEGSEARESKVAIKHTSPAQVEADLPISLEGKIDDPDAVVAKVTMYYRTGSSGKFKSTRVKYSTRKFTVEIPAEMVQPPLVEYYLEAVDEKGLPKATRGDAATPLRIAVPEGSSVASSPWLWVPLTTAVVGAVVAVVVVVLTSATSTSTVTVNVFE